MVPQLFLTKDWVRIFLVVMKKSRESFLPTSSLLNPCRQGLSQSWGGRVLAQMGGLEHKSKRLSVLQGMGSKEFRSSYREAVRGVVKEVIGRSLKNGRMDLVGDFGAEYSIRASMKLLGLPDDRHEEVAAWHEGVARYITSLRIDERERRWCLDSSSKIRAYLKDIIYKRRQIVEGGLVDFLMRSQGNSIGENEMVALVLNVLLAATEPSGKTVAYLFYHLLSNGDCLNRVMADRDLLSSAISESLRLSAPVQLVPRMAVTSTLVSGVELFPGGLVFCMPGAANRDPSVFDSPDKFIIERYRPSVGVALDRRASHLSFGVGAHACVGAAISMLQIECTMNCIFDELGTVRLEDDFVLQEKGFYTRGPTSVVICIDQPERAEAGHS